ncbi:FAD-dependent oxidoreductase [Nocardioides montaniterrae]
MVGAGIAGLLTALLLARAGRSVVVLEARSTGGGTSGRTTGKVSLLQGTKLSRARRLHPAQIVRQYVTASREGQAWLEEFCETHGVPLQDGHATTYATTAQGERRARAELDEARRCGLAVKWCNETEMPFTVRGAVRLDDQLQLDPLRLLAAVADAVEAAGGVIHEGTRVRDVRRTGERIELVAGDCSVRAVKVVLATNQPIGMRGLFFGRMRAQRSYALALEPTAPGGLWIPEGMHLSADAQVRSLRAVRREGAEDLLLIGGAGHETGHDRPGERLDELAAWAAETFTGGRVIHAWSAQDQSPLACLPYAGPVLPGSSDLLAITGFDKWGLSTAPAAALLLAASILGGRTPDWAGAFRTWSLDELRAVLGLASHNAAVGWNLACGHLTRAVGTSDRPLCTHLGGVLSWNDAEQTWDCPLHGSRFAEDGSVLEGPAVRPASVGGS